MARTSSSQLLKKLLFPVLICVATSSYSQQVVHALNYDHQSRILSATLQTGPSFVRRQLYINGDNNLTTGLRGGFDFLIENARLYEFTGNDGEFDWSWNELTDAPLGTTLQKAGNPSVEWHYSANLANGNSINYEIRIEEIGKVDLVESGTVETNVTLYSESPGQSLDIVDAWASIDESNWQLEVLFHTGGSYDRKILLIDSDINPDTGYDGGFDILVENGHIYNHNNPNDATAWEWDSMEIGQNNVSSFDFEDKTTWVFVLPDVSTKSPIRFIVENDTSNIRKEKTDKTRSVDN